MKRDRRRRAVGRPCRAATTALAIALAGSTGQGIADGSPIGASLYFDIGGGELVSRVPNPRASTIKIGLPPPMRLPTVCDLWEKRHIDLDAWVGMTERYLDEQKDRLTKAILAAVQDLVFTTAVAALQRELAGLYDYSQNVISQMQFQIDIAATECNDTVRQLDAGISPIDGWLRIGTERSWRDTLDPDYTDSLAPEDKNILAARESVFRAAGTQPIAWFGGDKGMSDAPDERIEFVRDIVSAGYASNASTTYGGGGAVVASPDTITEKRLGGDVVDSAPRLKGLWPDSRRAAEFAVRVLGEEFVSFCETCAPGVKPGLGLAPEYDREREALLDLWTGLLSGNFSETKPPTLARMRAVSSERTVLPPKLFTAIIRLEATDRDIMIYRLVSDVAAERTMEKAMALQQMLQAGANTPQVRAYELTREKADELSQRLTKMMASLETEITSLDKFSARTAQSILAAIALSEREGLSQDLGGGVPNVGNRIERGRVVPR